MSSRICSKLLVEAKAVLIQPDKIAVQVVGVGVDGSGGCAELCRHRIEPESGKPSIGTHMIFPRVGPATAPVTNFLSKLSLCDSL
jgi:hypothetical protein